LIYPFKEENDYVKMYKWLYKKTKKIDKINSKFKNDKFWLQLANVIEKNKIIEYNEDIIKQLNVISNNF